MNIKNILILSGLVVFALTGCVAEKTTTSSPVVPEKVSSTEVITERAGDSSPIADDGGAGGLAREEKPAMATKDLKSIPPTVENPVLPQEGREVAGEEIGIIGPIIALSGTGEETTISIYDPGGVFIGALYLREAQENPSRLENLLGLARARGALQNFQTIQKVSVLRFLNLALAAREKEMP